ncbi:hypothetical protein EJB05_48802, partial [Eragrostis curvula]
MKMYEDLPAEISHPFHKKGKHNFKLVSPGDAPFVCDGCKEPGEGPRYTCQGGCSSFDLHTCCALMKETLTHPLFGENCVFEFVRKPPPPIESTVCDACGEPAHGYGYHCHERDLDLHPCCATLQDRITLNGHTFKLQHAPRRGRCGASCREEGRRRKFWAYRSCYDGRSVYLHVACIREMARRAWDEAYQERVGGGGCIVRASAPIMEGVLQNVSGTTRRRNRFDQFMRIVGIVTKIIVALISGNPMAMIAAVAGPDGFLRG